MADLYALLREDSDFLKGASVADKVVGKAAAALMILGEVGELHADVVSRPALDLFADSGVRVSYGTAVPHIINVQRRDGARWKLVAGIALLHRIVSSELKSL